MNRLFMALAALGLAAMPLSGCSYASETVNPPPPGITIEEPRVPLADGVSLSVSGFDEQSIRAGLEAAGKACWELISALPAAPAAYPVLGHEENRQLVALLAGMGLVANSYDVDMAGWERVVAFCEAAEARRADSVTIFFTPQGNAVAAYALATLDGGVILKPFYYDYPAPEGDAEPQEAAIVKPL